jgi:sigma-B regulation protein RsbU (phosphoserine phosphatase)
MIDALNASAGGSPADVIKGVGDRIASFVKDAEQFDDMTMLCLSYKSKGEI